MNEASSMIVMQTTEYKVLYVKWLAYSSLTTNLKLTVMIYGDHGIQPNWSTTS